MTSAPHHPDSDEHKGAVEEEDPRRHGESSLSGQLPHRTDDPEVKQNDTDFPGPDAMEEHTGEHK